MAKEKKATIEGENLQGFTFESDWGGENNTDSPITVYGTTVPAGYEWGINRGEIERIIKEKAVAMQGVSDTKIGSFRFTPNQAEDGYVLLGFKDEADNLEWYTMSDSDKWGEAGLALILKYDALPSLSGETRTVRVQIESTPQVMQATDDVSINVKGISQITYGSGQTEDVGEELDFQIQTRTSQSADWTARGSVTIQSNLTTWTDVALKPYLSSGNNYVRFRAVSSDGTSSVWTTITLNVVALSLISATPVASPISGNTLELRYYIGGSADKTLRLQFGHYANSVFVADYSYETTPACIIPIGTAIFVSVAKTIEITPTTGVLDNILAAGNHVVRAKLYVSETVQTDWVETEYMVAGSTPTVVVNNIASGIENYTDVTFFKWAASQSMNVLFRLTNAGQTETYSTWEETAEAGVEKTLATQLSIDSQLETINAYMHIEDLDGNALHDAVFFIIDNNSEFAPVSNPTFVLQPSTRSNGETNPKTIINTVTGDVVPSTGWETFGMVSDGYINDSLVIPAGSQLKVDINPLLTLANTGGAETGLTERNVTIEIEFKASNITDEAAAMMRLGNYMNSENDHDIYGLEILPTEAALLTRNKRTRDDQNVMWAEDKRTRLTINIVYGLNPDNDPTGTRLNYVRLFINDTIEREFNYAANDSFIGSETAKLILGNTNPVADLTIYGIRCYTKALSTDDVMRDYRAALPTTAQKREWIAKNDIIGQNGAIDFEKAKNAGYNVIGHTGHLPKYGDDNAGETKGQVSLLVHINGDASHSGVLTHLDSKGQGTTAMTYRDWNQQYKITDNTVFTSEDGTVGAAGDGYVIEAGQAAAKKLVGKINFASSMQGHKMGLTRAFDELFKQMVADGQLSEPSQITRQPSARIAVYEKPFLFFHRETENDPWVFCYLMTFGAGKGDEPTFGFDKNATPNMMMVEGADNDRPLALFTAPWNDSVTYNGEKEAWYLGGTKNLNFGFGATTKIDGYKYPSSTTAITKHKDFWNFVYLHSRNVRFYDGTLSQLRAGIPLAQGDDGSYTTPSTLMTYWTVQADAVLGAAKYDLFRFDAATDTWVNASINGSDTLNMRTQYETFAQELSRSTVSWVSLSPLAVTNDAIDVRTSHFAAHAEEYMHVDDALYHQAFIKFFAGTDNRAKNTYYYTDPVTLKMRWEQDDVDTTIKTNNIGQQRKPYYVEEHDKNAYGEYYWQGEASGFYNLLESAFSDRLTQTMRRMMTAMATISGSVMSYLESRVLQAQEYFPAVAYNEQARLVYERASIAQSEGTYVNNSAQAITQSNGTQHWSEWQWLTDRVMYISSWCEYGEFASGTSASGALTFRGQTGTYAFTLTPAKWLYPRVVHGSSTKEASISAFRVRVPAGQAFAYKPFQNDGDTTISIRGINYYAEIGDMNIPLSASQQTTFEFAGKRLRKITVNPNGTDENLFVTQNINVTATNITEFVVRGVGTLRGEIDLRGCTHLQTIDMRGSTTTSVRMPQTSTLGTVKLPETLESINLVGLIGLTTLTIDGAANIVTATLTGTSISTNIASMIYSSQQTTRKLTSLTLTDVNWLNVSRALLMWLANTEQCVITGRIVTASTPQLTLAEVLFLFEKFGDITDEDNDLYVNYAKSMIYNIGVTGQKYFTQTGTTQFGITTGSAAGNNICFVNGMPDLAWTFIVDDGEGGEEESLISGGIRITDATAGTAEIVYLNEEGDETRHILQVTATLLSGTTITRRWKIGLFNRIPHRGDFAYADGTFDDDVHLGKTIVGYALRVTPNGSPITSYTVNVMCCYDNDALEWGIRDQNSDNNQTIPKDMRTQISQQSQNITLSYFNVDGSGFMDGKTETQRMTNRADYIINGWLKNIWDGIDLTAPDYDDTLTYAVGKTVTQNGYVYISKTSITEAGAFDSTKWTMLTDANLTKMRFAKTKAGNTELPQSKTELKTMIDAIIALEAALGATYPNNFAQIFFPVAYMCYMYVPNLQNNEIFNNGYALKMWHTPAEGVMNLIYQYFHASRNKTNNALPSATYANEDNTVADADYPLMSNVIARYMEAGLDTRLLNLCKNETYWSAGEQSTEYGRCIDFKNGTIRGDGKQNQFYSRPVTDFTYTFQYE